VGSVFVRYFVYILKEIKQHIRGLLNGLNNNWTYIQIWHTLKRTQPQVGKDIFTRT